MHILVVKSLANGAFPQTQLGVFTAPPDPLARLLRYLTILDFDGVNLQCLVVTVESGPDLAGGRPGTQLKLGLTETTNNARQLSRSLVGIYH